MAAGSAPYGDGYARLDTERLTVSLRRRRGLRARRADRDRAGARGRRLPDRPRARPRRRRGRLPRLGSHLRLRPDQRGVHDVSRVVLKLGGRVAAEAAREALALRAAGHDVVVVHGAGPQITAEMERRGIVPAFVDGRACDDGRGAGRRPRLARRGQRRGLRGDRPRRGAALRRRDRARGDAGRGARARRRPDCRPRPAAVEEALADGPDPGRRAARRRPDGRPLNVNADEAAAALAVGLGAERIVFVSDVPGVLLDGAVVSSGSRPTTPTGCSATAPSRAGSCPKLEAAVLAARGGVRAEIGATEVVA